MQDSSAWGSILCAGPDEHCRRLCQPLLDSALEPLGSQSGAATVLFGFVGRHRAIQIRSGPGVIRRPAGGFSRLGDHYLVLVPWSACTLISGGESCALAPGMVAAIDGDRGFELQLVDDGGEGHTVDWLHIAAPSLPELRRVTGCIAMTSVMLARYVSSHAKLIVKGVGADEPLAARMPVFDYIRRAIKDYVQQADAAEPEGSRSLHRIQSFIESHVGHPQLGADLIAREFGISKRKLYAVVGESGASLHDMIMAARLEAAHRVIEAGGQKMANLIRDHGFTNASTFYRNYKRRFGRTPRAG
jgi:AraC-like DNA-binding protein